MFLTLLVVTFLIAFVVSFIVTVIFKKPFNAILHRIVDAAGILHILTDCLRDSKTL